MNRQITWQTRALVVCAMILVAVQSAALGQHTAQDKAAKIAEVMTAAHKYRLFNGSALVAENGRVIYKKGLGLANMEWNFSIRQKRDFVWVRSPSSSPPR